MTVGGEKKKIRDRGVREKRGSEEGEWKIRRNDRVK